LARPTERVVAFYNQRGAAERWIKTARERSNGLGLPFTATTVRLQLHALARGRWRCPERWSRGRRLHEKLIKIDAKVISHGRYVMSQLAEVAVLPADVRRHPCR
jgi:hypothetical protein